jgi:hypothetical protein
MGIGNWEMGNRKLRLAKTASAANFFSITKSLHKRISCPPRKIMVFTGVEVQTSLLSACEIRFVRLQNTSFLSSARHHIGPSVPLLIM